MYSVSPRVKRILTVVAIGLLLVFAVIVFATEAQARAGLEYAEGVESSKGIGFLTAPQVALGQDGYPLTHGTARVTRPTPPASAQRTSIGSCYTEPGTPPVSVLRRENPPGDPRIWNRGGLSKHPNGSTASGCWQFIRGTWDGYGGYTNAADAPVAVQNAKAKEIWAGGAGCSHWSAC